VFRLRRSGKRSNLAAVGALTTSDAPEPSVAKEWEAEFEAARRRPLRTRLKYAFIRTYKPVLDDARYRSFETTAEYRAWCAAHLPSWLGYGPAL